MSSRLLRKNFKIKIYKTGVLDYCETLSLTLRKECRIGILENRILKYTFIDRCVHFNLKLYYNCSIGIWCLNHTSMVQFKFQELELILSVRVVIKFKGVCKKWWRKKILYKIQSKLLSKGVVSFILLFSHSVFSFDSVPSQKINLINHHFVLLYDYFIQK